MSSTIQRELDAIEHLIAAHPEGVGRADLAEEFADVQGEEIHTRTLQRRLKRLIEDGRIIASGEGTSRVYRPADVGETGTARGSPHPSHDSVDEDVPISGDAGEVLAAIRQPITRRTPVGYDRDFLQQYRPGVTRYLPATASVRLRELGTTPDPDRAAGTHAREILEHLLIDLSWASSRLEGNTYSRLDTANLIEFGQHAEGKDAAEAQMILNHKRAIEFLVDDAERIGFDRSTLLTLHALLSENLVGSPADEGRLRRRLVRITGTTYTPLAIPQLVEECFESLLAKAAAIEDPLEQSLFAMIHIPYLQPFVDVNKRTSRLAANIPLIKNNLFPLSFVDVPRRLYTEALMAVYELRRVEPLRDVFVWAYDRSCAQYRVIRDAVSEPDPIRFRYRDQIGHVVRSIVRDGIPPSRSAILERASGLDIAREDVDDFVERTLDVLVNLNEGSAGRYGITRDEWNAWRVSRGQQHGPG